MTSHTPEYFIEFPAVRSEQGGRVQYMLSVPMTMLKRILAFDAAGDVLSRSQRELNVTRAKKITRYLTTGYEGGSPYLLPPLVGNIDGEVTFRASGEVKGGLGMLSIPMDADIRLFDGQHRSRGIIDFISAHREAPDMITLLLTVGLSLETRQQFFSDINNNASKPATAISMAYNHKDPLTELVREVASLLSVLQERDDYEHNVVPAKSDLMVSFKALHDATRKMFGLRVGEPISGEIRADVITLWDSWAGAMNWGQIAGIIGPSQYRAEHIGTHGVMINAIGIATAMMLEHHCVAAVARMLANHAESGGALHDDFSHEAWRGICVDVQTGTVRCDALSQSRAAVKLLELFSMDPEHPNAWLRDCMDESVSDEWISEAAEKIMKVAAEKKLDPVAVKRALPSLIARSEEPMQPVLNHLRRLRVWLSGAFPKSEAA